MFCLFDLAHTSVSIPPCFSFQPISIYQTNLNDIALACAIIITLNCDIHKSVTRNEIN